MNALLGLLILTGMIYGIFIDATFWKLYAVIVLIYTIYVVSIKNSRENTKRKTLLISTWGQPSDPTSTIINDYNMEKAMAYAKQLNEQQKEVHVTVTHVFTHATAWGAYKMRRDIGRLPFGTFKYSKKIGVTVLVDVEGGKDLVPITVWDGHKMSIIELAKEISGKVDRAKKGKDEAHKKATASANFMPSFIAEPIGFALTYLAANCGISIPAMGLRANNFGHIIITNVGGMGFSSAHAPLCPVVHSMGLLCCGTIEKRPIVD
mmetsp:Transcript_37979/g.46353  ORF Transcript_37979/g.46353 Transcript_37979/m.46353 type:complete len:263 (-) Transcript_37979:253-1041(-)